MYGLNSRQAIRACRKGTNGVGGGGQALQAFLEAEGAFVPNGRVEELLAELKKNPSIEVLNNIFRSEGAFVARVRVKAYFEALWDRGVV